MPNMANITVKKADGTTDVIYVSQAPASGDATPARWRLDALGSVPGNRPTLTVSSRGASGGATRVVQSNFNYPETFTDSTTGITMVRSSVNINSTARIPQQLTETTIDEAVAQWANLMKAALMQDTLTSGFAPS